MLGPRIGPKIGPRFGPAIGVTADEISAADGGGVTPIAPRDPVTADQLVDLMGAPAASADYVTEVYIANTSASPINPVVGAFPMATTAGTPTYGVPGPSAAIGDVFSKAVRLTDAQAAQLGTANGAVSLAAHDWAIGIVANFVAAVPGGNRVIYGHNSTDDAFLQLRTNGHIFGVIVDSAVTTTIQLLTPHNTGQWVVIIMACAGGNVRVASNLGVSAPVALSPDIATTASWQIGQSGNCPAMDFHMGFNFISDDTAAGDAAILDIYNNAQAYCTDLLSALVDL
jgi:hypothetical protein